MAQAGGLCCRENLQCSICLDIFTNPASTPCGHSFCMTCIGRYWDNSRVHKCPMCKESFPRRPCLHINRALKEISEHFKGAQAQAERGDPQHVPDKAYKKFPLSGPEDSSWEPLYQKPEDLQSLLSNTDNILFYDGPMETDAEDHSTSLASMEEWNSHQRLFGTSHAEIQRMIRDRLIKAEELRTSLDSINVSADREAQTSMRVFKALINSVETAQDQLLELIEAKRLADQRQARSLMEELVQEIHQLRQRSSMLMQLAQAEDSSTLMLQHFHTLCMPLQTKDWSRVSMTSDLCMDGIHKNVSQLAEHFQEALQRLTETSMCFPEKPSLMRLSPREIKMEDYAVDVTFDSMTAHPKLILSEDKKQVWCGEKSNAVPDNPERFDRMVCLLACEGFTGGKHYWEVGVAGKTDWDIGVASYPTHRKGKLMVDPSHGYWFLSLRDNSKFNVHTQSSTSNARNQTPHIIGVFLDYEKGQVSFYNVDTKEHICTFTTTFSKTIYPFFSPCGPKSGRNEAPLVITPVH